MREGSTCFEAIEYFYYYMLQLLLLALLLYSLTALLQRCPARPRKIKTHFGGSKYSIATIMEEPFRSKGVTNPKPILKRPLPSQPVVQRGSNSKPT